MGNDAKYIEMSRGSIVIKIVKFRDSGNVGHGASLAAIRRPRGSIRGPDRTLRPNFRSPSVVREIPTITAYVHYRSKVSPLIYRHLINDYGEQFDPQPGKKYE